MINKVKKANTTQKFLFAAWRSFRLLFCITMESLFQCLLTYVMSLGSANKQHDGLSRTPDYYCVCVCAHSFQMFNLPVCFTSVIVQKNSTQPNWMLDKFGVFTDGGSQCYWHACLPSKSIFRGGSIGTLYIKVNTTKSRRGWGVGGVFWVWVFIMTYKLAFKLRRVA